MKVIVSKYSVTLHASGNDTRMWALHPSHRWPCSTLSGKGFTAEFDSDGLCDFSLKEGIKKDIDSIDGHELSAICCDLLKNRLPKSHPAYFVAVGQFL
jgi:hypothetical protein